MSEAVNSKKGGIREMITIALPMVISYACETVMIFTDRMFLSRLGAEFMNASMAGGVTAYMMMTFILGLTGYTTALAAQYLGAKQLSMSPRVAAQALIVALIGYPIIVLARPFAYILFDKSGLAPEQLEPQLIYFNTVIVFCFFTLFRHTLSSYFTAIGRTRIVMVSSVVAMLVNVVANYVLIFGKFGVPALGIKGAAYGTTLGAASGLVLLLIVYFDRINREQFKVLESFRFDWAIMKKLVRFGTPQGLEMFLNLLAFDLMILIFHSAGAVQATAATIALNWDMVTYVPLMGLEIGVTSLVGRYMGARDITSAARSTRSALGMAVFYSSVILIAFACFAPQLVDIFHSTQDASLFLAARPAAIFMLRLAIIYIWFESIFVVLIGSLRGAGDTWWCMWFSVILHWISVPIIYVMLNFFQLPVEAAWAALIGVFMMGSSLLIIRYRRGTWKDIRVVDETVNSLVG